MRKGTNCSSPSKFARQGRKEKCRRPFRGTCKPSLGACSIFVSSLAEEYTEPYYHLICCRVAIPLLITLFWRLQLQQQPSQEHSHLGSGPKEQPLLLQMRQSREGAITACAFSGHSRSRAPAASPAGRAMLPAPTMQWEQPVC